MSVRLSVMRETWGTDKLFRVFITNCARTREQNMMLAERVYKANNYCKPWCTQNVTLSECWMKSLEKNLFNKWTEHLKKTQTLIQTEKETIINRYGLFIKWYFKSLVYTWYSGKWDIHKIVENKHILHNIYFFEKAILPNAKSLKWSNCLISQTVICLSLTLLCSSVIFHGVLTWHPKCPSWPNQFQQWFSPLRFWIHPEGKQKKCQGTQTTMNIKN